MKHVQVLISAIALAVLAVIAGELHEANRAFRLASIAVLGPLPMCEPSAGAGAGEPALEQLDAERAATIERAGAGILRRLTAGRD